MYKSIHTIAIACLLVAGAFFITGGCSNSNGNGGNSGEGGEADQFTPLIVQFTNEPVAFPGSDGKVHLVYAVQITNATALPWQIESLEILNEADHMQTLASFAGEDVVASRNSLLIGGIPSDLLNGGESSIFYIDFATDSFAEVPEKLVHRFTITVPGGIPPPFLEFLELPPDTESLVQIYGVLDVSRREPLAVGPPLKGGRWISADGCCDSRHVRSLLAVNGKEINSQRFAIDYELLNDDNLIFEGDPHDLNSYFAYGQEIISVAEGQVVTAVDGLDEQIPGEIPTVTFGEADGNHVVVDLGGGNFALYAHMQKGSVAVEEGDFVTRGQLLGLVGNTGNTIAPHLHFHMMDGPSTFGANGVPYLFDSYELLGMSASTEAFNEAEAEGIPLEIVPAPIPGTHEDDLSLDQSIVVFPVDTD